ncbi:MAG: hypothetical protein JSR67_04815 [Proteobacteria bacterium]|nr:hypothetical protein [Pseudomonadota bacterium]
MHAEETTLEVPQLRLPADLLAEVSRRGNARGADFYRLESLKPTLLERLTGLFRGR